MASTTFVIDTNGKYTIEKDPDATLDYLFDWSVYLAAISDTLTNVQFLLSSGTLSSSSFDSTTATAWVSGGVAGETITLTCRITTSGGRVDDRSVYIKLKDM